MKKPVADFSKNKCRYDGLTNYCRECWRVVSRAQWLKNREKITARYYERRASGLTPHQARRSATRPRRVRPPQPPSVKADCDNCGLRYKRREGGATICRPCRDGKPITHGTGTTYSRGCRCRPCTDIATTTALRNRRKRLAAAGLLDDTRYRTRVHKHGGKYEHVDRQAVFDRDGWLCGICTKPVDKTVKWPAPMSVSLDHIVPLVRGGDHAYGNVQCSHLVCNQTKKWSSPEFLSPRAGPVAGLA